MVTQSPKRAALLAALAFTLSCIGLMIFVWTQFAGTIPFAPAGYEVDALFPETGQLVAGADVRVSGINVGKVTSVKARGTSSFVMMNLKQRYAPIPADTRAIVRLKTLLGEAYVELSTGTHSGPQLPDGGTIARSQVESTQSLDQVLDSFDQPTRTALVNFLDGTNTALSGQGEDLNNAIGNLDPTATELAAVVGVLNQQQGNVTDLVSNLGSVLTTLGDRSADLQSLVTAGDQVLSATTARDAQLTATVDALPPFLVQLRTTLGTLHVLLPIAKPSLDVIRTAAPLVQPALSDLISLSGPAVSLLDRAPHLVKLADAALPSISRFTLSFNAVLNPVLLAARQIVPSVNLLKLYKPDVISGMSNLAAITNAAAPTGTGNAKYFRASLVLNDSALFGQTERPSDERFNPYMSPGALTQLSQGGLRSTSCDNLGNTTLFSLLPLGLGNVPCRLQPAYPWGSTAPTTPSSYYPHVTAVR